MTFGEILIFTINSIFPLILLIMLGYILRRINFFDQSFLKYANKTVFYVCLPVLLFKNIIDIESLTEIAWSSIIYMVVIITLLFVVGLVVALLTTEPSQKGVLHQCIFRSNFALIGIPLSELIGGSGGVRVAALFSLFSIPIYNVLAVIVLSVYKKTEGSQKPSAKKILIGIAKNPLILGVLSGIVFVLLRSAIPANPVSHALSDFTFLYTAVSYIAKSATPLALIVLGGQFDFKKVSGYKTQLTVGVLGRIVFAPALGLVPAILLTKAGLLDFTPAVFAALIALFGTPVAVSSAVMAEAMDNDGQLAAQLVVWTSVLSIFTLFITVFLVKMYGML